MSVRRPAERAFQVRQALDRGHLMQSVADLVPRRSAGRTTSTSWLRGRTCCWVFITRRPSPLGRDEQYV